MFSSTKKSTSASVTSSSSTSKTTAESSSSKKTIKAYGQKTEAFGLQKSRSRTATKELELPPDDSLMHAPGFSTPLPKTLSAKDGEGLAIKCTVKGDPEPQITWFKDGEAVSSSDIVDLKYRQGLASLSINELFPEDAGKYTCKATSSQGEAECSCKLTVIPMEQKGGGKTAGDKAPRIMGHLASSEVADGTPMTLSTQIGGATKFDVVWLHNEKEIKPSKDFQYVTEGDKYILKIAEVFPEDGGTYTCEAFNDVGEAFSTCTLVVTIPQEQKKQPAFKTFPKSVTVMEGKPATFKMSLEKEASKISWSKDGKPLHDESPRYKLTADGKSASFDIPQCLITDVGQYSVKAGENRASFSLNVHTSNDL